jgi:hypothetical protein
VRVHPTYTHGMCMCMFGARIIAFLRIRRDKDMLYLCCMWQVALQADHHG